METFLDSLIDHLPSPLFVKDAITLRYVHWNKAAEVLYGLDRNAVLGRGDHELFAPEIAERTSKADRALLASGRWVAVAEEVVHTPAFGLRHLHTRRTVMPGPDGQARYLLVTVDDVTERRLSEAARSESEALLRALFEYLPEAVLLIDPHDPTGTWPIIDCNAAACWMNGYSREELIGSPLDLLNATPSTEAGHADYLARLRQAGHLTLEAWHRHKDGSVFPIETSTALINLGGRELILGIDRNVTERKRAEAALRESETIFRRSIEAAGAVPYRRDHRTGQYTYMGEGIRAITGYGPDEITVSLFEGLIEEVIMTHQTQDYGSWQKAKHAVRSGNLRTWRCDLRIKTRTGETRWLADASVEVEDEAGVAVGSIGILQDITESRRTYETLRRQNSYLAALHETTLGLLSRLDLSSLLEAIVSRAAQLVETAHGYVYLLDDEANPPEMEVRVGIGLCAQDLGLRLKSGLGVSGKVWQSQHPLVVSNYDEWDGRLPGYRQGVFRSVMAVPLISGQQVIGVIGLMHTHDSPRTFGAEEIDLLTRFAQLASIALDNARLHAETQQHAAESAALYRASAQLLSPGAEPAELAEQIAQAVTHEFALVNCSVLILDDAGTELRRLANVGDFQVTGAASLSLDGPGLTVAAARTGEMVYAPDARNDPRYLAKDSRTRSELVMPLKARERVIGVLDLQSPEPNAFNERARRIVTAFAKHAELALDNALLVANLAQAYRRLQDDQEQLLSAEKMASLGRLTAGIAHEMNTPLAAVRSGLAELGSLVSEYQSAIGDGEITPDDHHAIAHDMARMVRLADAAAERAAAFVRSVKAQTRDLAPGEPQHFNAVPVVKDTLILLGHALRQGHCRATFEHDQPTMQLLGSPGRLAQVLTNLITNAIDASLPLGGGPIHVQLTYANRGLDLRVTDSGVGMAPELLPRIFEPMFTTKPFGQGTGLGLTIVHDIVTGDFGGTIEVSSQPGQGSTFTVHFPLPQEHATS